MGWYELSLSQDLTKKADALGSTEILGQAYNAEILERGIECLARKKKIKKAASSKQQAPSNKQLDSDWRIM